MVVIGLPEMKKVTFLVCIKESVVIIFAVWTIMNPGLSGFFLPVQLYSLIEVLAVKPASDTDRIYLKQNVRLISGLRIETVYGMICILFMKVGATWTLGCMLPSNEEWTLPVIKDSQVFKSVTSKVNPFGLFIIISVLLLE